MSNLHVVIVIPAFSSTWVKDILLMVDTQGIKSDARGHFIDDAPGIEFFDPRGSLILC